MFWNKKKKIKKNKYEDIQTTVIPDVFYGGQDPYIYHPHEDVVSSSNVASIDDKSKNKKIAKKQKNKKTKSSVPRKPLMGKKLWIILSILFVIVVGLISWYYLAQYNKAKLELSTQNNNQIVEVVKNNNVQVPEVIIAPTTTQETNTVEIPTTTPSLENAFLEFPPILTVDTVDIDADSLTDIEEEVFKTDSGTWDTDKDNYYDGQEVFNLYNPNGQAPVKIIDSGLVKEYKNLLTGYRLYYPTTWQKGSVDKDEKQVLFSASTGEYIEVRVLEKGVLQEFATWFSRYAEGQNYNDLSSFTNRFSEKALVRKDSLVAYFEDNNYVYSIIYHQTGRGSVVYRHIMQMVYQSFRMQKNDVILPDQTVYPNEGITTDTVNIILPSLDTSVSSTATSSNN